jgi:hypothetical protein
MRLLPATRGGHARHRSMLRRCARAVAELAAPPPPVAVLALAGALACSALLLPRVVHAEDVLYRCTDAAGRVIWQNRRPCTKGQAQQIRRIEVPAGRAPALRIAPPASGATATPAPVPAPPPVPSPSVGPIGPLAPLPQATPPPLPDHAAATPPPPLYRCTRWDGGTQMQESATPVERCKPLATTGLDGDVQGGAGSACETVHDVCTPVPAEALCSTWKNRIDEARFRWRYAGDGPQAATRKAEYDALASRYEASTCALAPKNQ